MSTLYIPSTLNSYFLEQLKKLPAVGSFRCLGERPEVIAYKIYGDVSLGWIIMHYNGVTHPYDGSFSVGKVITFPSLNSIEKLYSTLVAKKRSSEEGSN